jgi:hypothetical protein
MTIVWRVIYYVWILTVFSLSYSLILDFENVGVVKFVIIWISGGLILGWIGDAILFGKGSFFGRTKFRNIEKFSLIGFIVLAPFFSMITDLL